MYSFVFYAATLYCYKSELNSRDWKGGGVKLRETSPRSPTPGLPGPARLKGAGLWDSGATVAIRVL
jgi:hypothetical protein